MQKIKSQSSQRFPKPGSKGSGRQGQKPSVKGPKKAYVSQSSRVKNAAPKVQTTTDSCRIQHKEFLQDVAGSVAFSAISYPINPGIGTTFPWLSQIARRYETYHFEKLRFCYEPRCSTTTAGTVVLAIDYDPRDDAPSTKADVLAYYGAVGSSPWDETTQICDSLSLSRKGNLFVRGSVSVPSTDIKTYDLGNLFLCRSGFAGTDACGELYVEYICTLHTPQISTDTISGALVTGTAGLDATHLFGTTVVVSANSGLSITVTASDTLTFNESWEGMAVCRLIGTGVDPTDAFAVGGTVTSTLLANTCGQTAVASAAVLACKIRASKGQTFIPTAAVTSVTSCTWYFCQFDYDLS